jgi:hypothetical protein
MAVPPFVSGVLPPTQPDTTELLAMIGQLKEQLRLQGAPTSSTPPITADYPASPPRGGVPPAITVTNPAIGQLGARRTSTTWSHKPEGPPTPGATIIAGAPQTAGGTTDPPTAGSLPTTPSAAPSPRFCHGPISWSSSTIGFFCAYPPSLFHLPPDGTPLSWEKCRVTLACTQIQPSEPKSNWSIWRGVQRPLSKPKKKLSHTSWALPPFWPSLLLIRSRNGTLYPWDKTLAIEGCTATGLKWYQKWSGSPGQYIKAALGPKRKLKISWLVLRCRLQHPLRAPLLAGTQPQLFHHSHTGLQDTPTTRGPNKPQHLMGTLRRRAPWEQGPVLGIILCPAILLLAPLSTPCILRTPTTMEGPLLYQTLVLRDLVPTDSPIIRSTRASQLLWPRPDRGSLPLWGSLPKRGIYSSLDVRPGPGRSQRWFWISRGPSARSQ